MPDQRNQLQTMFELGNRWGCFGELLTRIRVQGVRCHSDTIIEIDSPIAAFCGANGTGKSTLLHLAAAAYRSPIRPRFRFPPWSIQRRVTASPTRPIQVWS